MKKRAGAGGAGEADSNLTVIGPRGSEDASLGSDAPPILLLRGSAHRSRQRRETVMSRAPFSTENDRQLAKTTEQQGRRYLLFAGTQQPPNGGLGDLVDTFMSEEAARRAFREIRLRTRSTTNWAQLAVVDREQGVRPLCWFGIGAQPERYPSVRYRPAPDAPAGEPRVNAGGRPYLSNRVRLLIAALVAVATTMIGVLVADDAAPPPVNRQHAVSVPAENS